MSKTVVFDFSKVLAFSNDPDYQGDLNPRHDILKELPDFDFFVYFRMNEELLAYVREQKALQPEIRYVIFTSGDIQQDPAISELLAETFDEIISLEDLDDPTASKTDPGTYLTVCERIGTPAQEVLFIDDSAKNIAAASAAGLNTKQYLDNNAEVFAEIGSFTSRIDNGVR
jgi:HAD superfamily hydrolase (TIGR01549 family)